MERYLCADGDDRCVRRMLAWQEWAALLCLFCSRSVAHLEVRASACMNAVENTFYFQTLISFSITLADRFFITWSHSYNVQMVPRWKSAYLTPVLGRRFGIECCCSAVISNFCFLPLHIPVSQPLLRTASSARGTNIKRERDLNLLGLNCTGGPFVCIYLIRWKIQNGPVRSILFLTYFQISSEFWEFSFLFYTAKQCDRKTATGAEMHCPAV